MPVHGNCPIQQIIRRLDLGDDEVDPMLSEYLVDAFNSLRLILVHSRHGNLEVCSEAVVLSFDTDALTVVNELTKDTAK